MENTSEYASKLLSKACRTKMVMQSGQLSYYYLRKTIETNILQINLIEYDGIKKNNKSRNCDWDPHRNIIYYLVDQF